MKCNRGWCHYKLCTSRTIQKPSDLWCAFCSYNEREWADERKRLLPECELWFMAVLMMAGIDQDFCMQVVPLFWHQPMDFYCLSKRYFVQVDGRSHWVGMRELSRDQALARDMQQNLAAIQAGASLVRVHEDDISNDACVLAALEAASQGCCIVLTPAYAAEQYMLNGNPGKYGHGLLSMAPNCCYDRDQYGNCRFWSL